MAIGRALITKPSLVLADEPTGNLDSQNSSEVLALLKDTARKYEQTVIMITHNPAMAHMADRVFRVSDGMVMDLGECRGNSGSTNPGECREKDGLIPREGGCEE